MKKLSSYIWKYKFGYLLVLIALIISISLDMLSPLITKRLVDDVILGGMDKLLYPLLSGFLIIGVGRFFCEYIKEYTCDFCGSAIACEMRKDLFRHMQGLSANFFDKFNTGELMARVKDDIDRIMEALSFVTMLIVQVLIHTTIILFCMFKLNVRLAIIPAICMIICGFVAIYMEMKLNRVYGEISEENAILNTVASENLSGIRTVKAFAREKFEIDKFFNHNKRYHELNLKQSKVFVKIYPFFQFITRFLPVVTLLLGGLEVINGQITLGTLTAFVAYSTNIVWPMEMLGWLTNCFASSCASYKKIKVIYAEQPVIVQPQVIKSPETVAGEITFNHVNFCKEDKHPILTNISFHIPKGHTLGIMGATGAGKTSIIYLLQRLYDVADGSVSVDNVDVRDWDLNHLRSSISVVMQDVFLFSDTISDNIKLGKQDSITASTVRKASKAAVADEFIEKLDEQYETVIGERGIGLSGGQKQRISIARAIAKKNPILVLDDSTSALDTETEYLIQKSLEHMTSTTKIIIAHRISAVRNADEIIYLEDGHIAESGTHAQLMQKRGLYYETFVSQYGEPDSVTAVSDFSRQNTSAIEQNQEHMEVSHAY